MKSMTELWLEVAIKSLTGCAGSLLCADEIVTNAFDTADVFITKLKEREEEVEEAS